jgi:ribosomal protein S18 acetylase RimI-like enzyme
MTDIEWWDGPHSELRASFELAEDSAEQLDSYLDLGRVLVARRDGRVVGHLQLIDADDARTVEIKSLAVAEDLQGQGLGRRLVEAAVAEAAAGSATCVVVSTATADVGVLRFYQRAGFRFLRVERDAFTPETGYPEPIDIDGVPLRDRIWLSLDLVERAQAGGSGR